MQKEWLSEILSLYEKVHLFASDQFLKHTFGQQKIISHMQVLQGKCQLWGHRLCCIDVCFNVILILWFMISLFKVNVSTLLARAPVLTADYVASPEHHPTFSEKWAPPQLCTMQWDENINNNLVWECPL